jgi:23S rRNA (cytosine1962-C5)-methyltransferase
VFSGSVERVEGEPAEGDVVDVRTHDDRFVARGLYNPHSQIRVRLYSWLEEVPLDTFFWQSRVAAAVHHRAACGLLDPAGACRLVFSEADGLSGLTVDRYGPWLSVQFTSLALWQRRAPLLDALETTLAPHGPRVQGMVLRTEKGIGTLEGLDVSDGPLRGDAPDGPVTYRENGLDLAADLGTGQKTGAYLDQRENRARAALLAPGRRVADVCCYTGGFALPMLAAGAAQVAAVDVSRSALALARANARRNDLDDGRVNFTAADAFAWLEGESGAGRRYDMVVLDPPRFARSARGVPQALKGYGRLNELAVRVLEPGGWLITCSCTGRVSRDQFLGVLAGVEERTGRRLRVVETRGQPPDHPVSPACPETAYLKCVICAVE